jgi:hypothetical protein
MSSIVSVYPEEFKDLMYFGKTYCNPTELLERTVNYQKFRIPHEVLLEEGAIMYSLNWLFAEGTLEYLQGFPKTNICDKLGRETVYKIELDSNSKRITIIGPIGEVEIKVALDGSVADLTSWSDEAITETMRDLFRYDVH